MFDEDPWRQLAINCKVWWITLEAIRFFRPKMGAYRQGVHQVLRTRLFLALSKNWRGAGLEPAKTRDNAPSARRGTWPNLSKDVCYTESSQCFWTGSWSLFCEKMTSIQLVVRQSAILWEAVESHNWGILGDLSWYRCDQCRGRRPTDYLIL